MAPKSDFPDTITTVNTGLGFSGGETVRLSENNAARKAKHKRCALPGGMCVVATATITKSVYSATNSWRPHARSGGYSTHAEVAVLSKLHPGNRGLAELTVVRYRADGSLGMAHPCARCQKYLADCGVERVFYSDSAGLIQRLW